MNIGIIIHSFTGNTLSVAEKIRDELGKSGHKASIERVKAVGESKHENLTDHSHRPQLSDGEFAEALIVEMDRAHRIHQAMAGLADACGQSKNHKGQHSHASEYLGYTDRLDARPDDAVVGRQDKRRQCAKPLSGREKKYDGCHSKTFEQQS